MRFLLKGNGIHIHIAFLFLTVRFLLFQNSSDPDFTPNMTYSLLLLEMWIVSSKEEGFYIFKLILAFAKLLIEHNWNNQH